MCKDLAQDICARARRIPLVAGGHVAGTHCAAHEMGLAAVAGSVALLCGAQDTPSFRKSQHGLKLPYCLVWFIAQACVHRRRVRDLARIEDTGGIPCALDHAEESIVLLAD